MFFFSCRFTCPILQNYPLWTFHIKKKIFPTRSWVSTPSCVVRLQKPIECSSAVSTWGRLLHVTRTVDCMPQPFTRKEHLCIWYNFDKVNGFDSILLWNMPHPSPCLSLSDNFFQIIARFSIALWTSVAASAKGPGRTCASILVNKRIRESCTDAGWRTLQQGDETRSETLLYFLHAQLSFLFRDELQVRLCCMISKAIYLPCVPVFNRNYSGIAELLDTWASRWRIEPTLPQTYVPMKGVRPLECVLVTCLPFISRVKIGCWIFEKMMTEAFRVFVVKCLSKAAKKKRIRPCSKIKFEPLESQIIIR